MDILFFPLLFAGLLAANVVYGSSTTTAAASGTGDPPPPEDPAEEGSDDSTDDPDDDASGEPGDDTSSSGDDADTQDDPETGASANPTAEPASERTTPLWSLLGLDEVLDTQPEDGGSDSDGEDPAEPEPPTDPENEPEADPEPGTGDAGDREDGSGQTVLEVHITGMDDAVTLTEFVPGQDILHVTMDRPQGLLGLFEPHIDLRVAEDGSAEVWVTGNDLLSRLQAADGAGEGILVARLPIGVEITATDIRVGYS